VQNENSFLDILIFDLSAAFSRAIKKKFKRRPINISARVRKNGMDVFE
jgi:hypothetical protein